MSLKVKADNFLQLYGRARSLLPFVLTQPLGYFFYITKRCNLNCEYCWQRQTTTQQNKTGSSTEKELTAGEWSRVIRSISPLSFIGLSGGEPLLHPGFTEILQSLGGRFRYTVNTNAELLNDIVIEELIRTRASNISVSLDGFVAVHDVSRCRPGLFDRVTEGIRRLNNYKKKYRVNYPEITIKIVLSDEVIDSLPEFYRFCNEELQAGCLNISFMKTSPHAQFDFNVRETLAEAVNNAGPQCYSYREKVRIPIVIEELLRLARGKRCKVLLYPKMNGISQMRSLLQSSGQGAYNSCYIPWGLVVILPSGDIIPCLSMKIANIRELNYDVRKISAVPAYRQFLKWRDVTNRSGKMTPACNMCCFARVKPGASR